MRCWLRETDESKLAEAQCRLFGLWCEAMKQWFGTKEQFQAFYGEMLGSELDCSKICECSPVGMGMCGPACNVPRMACRLKVPLVHGLASLEL